MGKYFGLTLLALVVCALVVLPVVTYAYTCIFYSDSAAVYFPGYGDACAGYSIFGCTECWDSGSGESCVEGGFNNCMQEEHQRGP